MKLWTQNFFLLLSFGLIFVMSINYFIDPFNIFGVNVLKNRYQPNERFLKIQYLEKNHHKYNSYMFGSSRIGTTHPKIIEQYIPGSKFYNFTISNAKVEDHVKHLEYFIAKNYALKNIYLQLDISDIMYGYSNLKSDYLRKKHPYVTGDNLAVYYFKYLTALPLINIQQKVLNNIYPKEDARFDLNDTGMWFRDHRDKKIALDHEGYVKNEPEFHKKFDRDISMHKSYEKNIIGIEKIINICKKNNMKLYIFIMPHHHLMLDRFNIDDMEMFLNDLARITSYWNFSYYNSVTEDDYNYYESSHYREIIGRYIAGKIFVDSNMKIPNDFGKKIRKKN